MIEMMVTLVIVTLLASVAIPLYQNYTKKAKAAEAWTELEHIATLEDQLFTDTRQYDTNGTKLPAYGAKFTGKYFVIQITAGTGGPWIASAYLCFGGADANCTANFDYRFTIDQSGTKTSLPQGASEPEPGWKL